MIKPNIPIEVSLKIYFQMTLKALKCPQCSKQLNSERLNFAKLPKVLIVSFAITGNED
jgi:ubiquitin C-terminal hydrolase